MRNYVSVNAKYYKGKELGRIINHNFRIESPDYLLKKESIKYENLDMIFNKDGLKTQNYKLSKEVKAEHLYNVFHDFKDARDEIYKKKKYHGNPNSNDIIEMVVVLSEEKVLDYLKNGESMMDGLENFAQIMKKEYGLEPLAISLHLDEGFEQNEVKNNIHAHLSFFNFDFKQERSRWRNITRSDTSKFQDLAQKAFQEKGYDFIRGESKEISGKQNLKRNDHILKEQKEKIKKLEIEYKNIVAIVNNAKKEEQALLKSHEKLSKDYEEVYKNVGELRELEKKLRKTDIKSFNNETKLALNDIFKNNIKDNKILNIETFVKQITNFVKNIHEVEFTNITENETKLKEKDNKINQLEEQNNTLLEKLNLERNKNKDSEQNKGQIAAQNQKLIQTMDKQQKALQRQIRTNTRLRRQRQRLMQKIMKDNNLTKAMQTRKFLRNNKNLNLTKNKNIKQENYDFDR